MESHRLALGGGCHWCTEAVFQLLPGVTCVEQGYVKSTPPNEGWSEGILLSYDHNDIIEEIVTVHLLTHASTVVHSRRSEYRSAFYFLDEYTRFYLASLMNTLSRKHNKNYITQILPFMDFKPSRQSIQNYYRTRPDAPFCKRYIEPKLKLIGHLTNGELSSKDCKEENLV